MIDTSTIRKKILVLALEGKLTEQLPSDGNAQDLFDDIQKDRKQLINQGIIKKNKKLPKLTEEDIPFVIPSNWKWVRLGNCINLLSGQDFQVEDYNDTADGIPYMTGASNIEDGKLVVNRWTSTPKNISHLGDLLLVCKGSGYGKIAFNNVGNVHIARQFMAISANFGINLDYIANVLVRNIDKIRSNGQGLIPGIDRPSVLNMVVPLPPIDEQQRIVARVWEMFEILQQLDELQLSYESDLKVIKTKLFDAGIRGKLTEQFPSDGTAEELFAEIQAEKANLIMEKIIKKEKPLPEITEDEIPFVIPANWKWVRLNDICAKISSGNTPVGGSKGGAYVDKGYCFFREQNIYNDGIHYDGMVYITEELLNTRTNSTVLPKDILLNITGGSIGRCTLVPDNFTRGSINQHILIIRTVDPRIRFYVHKCLCSPYYQKLIMGNVVGDKDGFSAGRCKNTLIPLPPLNEHKRISEKIDEMLSYIE